MQPHKIPFIYLSYTCIIMSCTGLDVVPLWLTRSSDTWRFLKTES
jgi:hypothetical protein